MKILREMRIIILIAILGEAVHLNFNLPIPGNVLGMVILFICLYFNIIKITMISEISKFLLDYLAFFFVPAGVGILTCLPFLKGKLISVFLIIIISTILVIAVTGWVIQLYIRKVGKK